MGSEGEECVMPTAQFTSFRSLLFSGALLLIKRHLSVCGKNAVTCALVCVLMKTYVFLGGGGYDSYFS